MNANLPLLTNTNIARKGDPETSHAGDRAITSSGKRSEQQLAVLAYVREFPGLTPRELGAKAASRGDKTLPHEVFHKRLPEMAADHDRFGKPKAQLTKRGRQRVCSVSKRPATPWYEFGAEIPPEQQEIPL